MIDIPYRIVTSAFNNKLFIKRRNTKGRATSLILIEHFIKRVDFDQFYVSSVFFIYHMMNHCVRKTILSNASVHYF